MAEDRWLIAGLGNPGPPYAASRHNAGFMVADELAARIGASFRRHRSRAHIAEGRLSGTGLAGTGPAGDGPGSPAPVTVAKPACFMNLSGGPVAALCGFYKIPPARLVVIHDELDIPFTAIRLKRGGGDNGHNGLRSVTAALGTRDYYRARLGIGRPPGRMDPADFVLRDFTAAERPSVPGLIADCADAVTILVTHGLAAAQNRFHPARQPGG
ncbi:MAG TPA: aminoacyl-tRNA hydrolase [Streptosporangiaceae bacterium]|jgi:PTH1 family peptidyl-tRNA hydrolase